MLLSLQPASILHFWFPEIMEGLNLINSFFTKPPKLGCCFGCKSPFRLMTDRTDDSKRGTQHVTLTRRGESADIEGSCYNNLPRQWVNSNNWEKPAIWHWIWIDLLGESPSLACSAILDSSLDGSCISCLQVISGSFNHNFPAKGNKITLVRPR